MYLCLCKGITDSDVREAGQAGIVMPCQLKAKFGLKESGCCGRCSNNIHEFAQIAKSAHQPLPQQRTKLTKVKAFPPPARSLCQATSPRDAP